MQQWADIRRRVLQEGVSKRQILRETGMHWSTLEKILSTSQPPGYRMQKLRQKPKLGPFVDRIRQILQQDKQVPKKQRHTAKRIFERLQAEGYTGGYTVVKEAVSEIKRTSKEVYMPLVHRPGDAQVDYFHALARLGGVLQKVAIFLMALPYSDAFFMMCSPRECTESFWEGHVRAFDFFGGVPGRISFDNSKIAVRAITGVHSRKLTDGFLQLASHYLFDSHFCTVRRGNEKGLVEGTGGYARRNFLVPVPQMAGFAELNAYLQERCRDDLQRQLRGQPAAKHELLQEDQAAFLPLPATPLDACRSPGQLPVRGPLLWQRLLRAGALRPPRGHRQGLLGSGGSMPPGPGRRQTPAVVAEGRDHVRAPALPASSGTQARRPGSRTPVAGVGPSGVLRGSQAPSGG